MNRVAVVVLNWNGIEDTLVCVDSLSKQTYHDFTTIIVDNGSRQESLSKLEKLENGTDRLTVIYNPINLGFAGGVNIGIRRAFEHRCDYVALLNNDAVIDEYWLEELVSSLDTLPKVGIATGLLLDEHGKTIDSTGEQYSKWGLPFPSNRGEPRSATPESGYVFGASGGASLYRLDTLRNIDLFDEDFFAYYEDVDISFRAQLAGWKVYYNKQAVAFHKKGATSNTIPGFTVYQAFKNLPLLLIKNVPFPLLPSVVLRFYLAYTVFLFKAILRGDGIVALKGVYKSITLTPAKLRARHAIQQNTTVSASYVKSLLCPTFPPKS